MKRGKIPVLVLALIFLCTASGPAQHITRTLDADGCAISIDANVHIPEAAYIAPVYAVATQWREEMLNHLFFGDEAIEYYRQTDFFHPVVDGCLTNGSIMFDNPEKGSVLAHVSGTFEYTSPKLVYDDTYVFWDLAFELPAEIPRLDENASKAADALRAMAISLGLYPGEVMSIRYCDEAFRSEHGLFSDAGYLILMELRLNGVPCYPYHFYSTRDMLVRGSSIQGYVVNGEVQYVSTLHAAGYEMIGNAGTSAALLTVDEAIDKLVQRYSNLIMDGPVHVEQIRLAYAPVPLNNRLYHMEMRPAWCFYTENEIILIDAVTGREIR